MDKVEKILSHYGYKAQLLMAIEEMSELTKEICKGFRGQENKQAIIEEIADVSLMLDQLVLLYSSKEEIEAIKQRKIERTLERIANKNDLPPIYQKRI